MRKCHFHETAIFKLSSILGLAQAERQAVNSKIQGSASDIAKKAMVEVENNLNKRFPGRSNLPSSLHTSHLVLQLHDEFIYEVLYILLN